MDGKYFQFYHHQPGNSNKNGGYGVFMWYDLHGTNETSQLSAGTQTLYGEPTVLSGTLQSWTQGTNCDALSDCTQAILQEQAQN